MRRFFVLIGLILIGCSVNDGINGLNGEDGFSIGLLSKDIDDCKELTFYKDLNRDGFFDEGEDIIDSFLICSGDNGQDGVDGTDGTDGTDGQDGVDGEDGVDGQDGISIGLLSTSLGQGCNRLTFFYDVNYNKTLEESEETIAVIDLCDGEDGTDGVDGTDGTDGQDATTASSKVTLNGVAQKGPFLNGSSVIISELDNEYSQTGKSFNVQIEDNSGKFNIKNIPLVSSYINTRVDGFYYNEITGKKSNAQITLNGIVDISENKAVNLNVLTHLEKARVEYLLANTSLTFKQAKDKAQEEILSIFEIDKDDVSIESEKMDIASNKEESKVLLSISSILQGYRTEAEFSSLLADIISDIRTDGSLDNASYGSQLISHAKVIDPAKVKSNVQSRYDDLNVSTTVLDFSSVLNNFITKTSYIDNVEIIDFPETLSNGGINVLGSSNDTITLLSGEEYYFAANVPVKEMDIKLNVNAIEHNGHSSGGSYFSGAGFYYQSGHSGLLVSRYNKSETPNQVFTYTQQADGFRVVVSLTSGWKYKVDIIVNDRPTPYKTVYFKAL